MTPQELFGGLVEVILDCKDTVFTKDGFIDEKDTSVPLKTSVLINELLKWKKKCEEDNLFLFPYHINSDDRKYTSCDWLIGTVNCFAHAACKGELNLLKWIKKDVKDTYFFWIDDNAKDLINIVGLSQEAIPVIKWIKDDDYNLFLKIKDKFQQYPLMTYEMLCLIFELEEQTEEEILFHRKRYFVNDQLFKSDHKSWPKNIDIPIRYFINTGDVDQLTKYFDRFVRTPDEFRDLANLYYIGDIDDVLCNCTGEMFQFLMSKLSFHDQSRQNYSFDLEKAGYFYGGLKKENLDSFTDYVRIRDFKETDLLRLFDVFTKGEDSLGFEQFSHRFSFGRDVTKCLVRYRLDVLREIFADDLLPYEISMYDFRKYGIDTDSMVMIYEAICL